MAVSRNGVFATREAAVPVFFEPASYTQLIFGLMVCFASFGLYMRMKPFREPSDNVVSAFAHCQV